MNGTEWTPGPWVVDDEGNFPTVYPVDPDGEEIADCYTQANAHLIAAAPELYEAAKNFVEWADDVWGSHALSERTKGEYEKAVAALKKARGEQ